jgi:glutathione peroxidase
MNRNLILGLTILMFFFKNSAMANYEKKFYDFKIESISGEIINLNEYKDKVVLLVNIASYCGFTKQYEDLQNLWEKYQDKG